jgi:hypothetical protein
MLSVLKGSELLEKLSLEKLLPYMEREKDEVDWYVKSVESLQVCLKQSGFSVGVMDLESACEAKVGEYILFHTDCPINIGFCYLLGGCRYIFETDCKRTVMNMDLNYGFELRFQNMTESVRVWSLMADRLISRLKQHIRDPGVKTIEPSAQGCKKGHTDFRTLLKGDFQSAGVSLSREFSCIEENIQFLVEQVEARIQDELKLAQAESLPALPRR